MIALATLAGMLGAEIVFDGDRATLDLSRIVDLDHDSRRMARGSLFACIAGARFDGHDHAREAIANGAAALLVQRPVATEVPNLVVGDVRSAIGPAAAAVHGNPCDHLDLIGVTGTNGKTSVVRILNEILNSAGVPSDEIGTLSSPLTTPEAPELQRRLAAAVTGKRRTVVMEVSSHALDQRRVDGCRFAVAVFTNLGRDHLDHHGNLEAYFAAKSRLFESARSQQAVIDIVSKHGRLLADGVEIPVTRVDSSKIEVLAADGGWSRFRWRNQTVELQLGGAFNVANAVVAAETALLCGPGAVEVAESLARVKAVPGRFELIEAGQDFSVIVDYAHTPEGLEAVLGAARSLVDGDLTVVFGAGGERDQAKRPRMGAVAERLADRTVITNDNPRSENPERIMAAIVAGMDRCPTLAEPQRRSAIRQALAGARTGDAIVIAGRGHEPFQLIGSERLEFDDRIVVREELVRLLQCRACETRQQHPSQGGQRRAGVS